ncbi:MAG: helix-turn-helix domain-containing protein [Azospirillum sp.]|nr:helix-turn-helix domain-containing protein [Azospirillum sp.]
MSARLAVQVDPLLPPLERSVRVDVAAEILDCSACQVRKLIRRGDLTAHRVGTRGIRVLLSSIDRYRAAMTLTPAGKAGPPPSPPQPPSPAHFEAVAYLQSLGIPC